jgi:hypothetical protein
MRTPRVDVIGLMIVVVVAVAIVSGCTVPTSPAAAPSAPPSATGETPSPSPEATLDPLDPSAWIIDWGGVGPLIVGAPLSEVPSLMTAFTDATRDECANLFAYQAPGIPTVSLPDPFGTGLIGQILIAKAETSDEPINAGPLTEAGIGIGSTLEQLRAAYPQLIQNVGPYNTVIYGITDDEGRWINFSFGDATLESSPITLMVIRDAPHINGEYC